MIRCTFACCLLAIAGCTSHMRDCDFDQSPSPVDSALLALETDEGMGSATALSEDMVILAKHCLKPNTDQVLINGQEVELSIIAEGEKDSAIGGGDWVLAQVNGIRFDIKPAQIRRTQVEVGETLYVSGFPLGAAKRIKGTREYFRRIRKPCVLEVQLTKVPLGYRSRDWTGVILCKGPQPPVDGCDGFSGGPVRDAEGRLVGIYLGTARFALDRTRHRVVLIPPLPTASHAPQED